jgi:hypothetical protein
MDKLKRAGNTLLSGNVANMKAKDAEKTVKWSEQTAILVKVRINTAGYSYVLWLRNRMSFGVVCLTVSCMVGTQRLDEMKGRGYLWTRSLHVQTNKKHSDCFHKGFITINSGKLDMFETEEVCLLADNAFKACRHMARLISLCMCVWCVC